jgi:hypothetical protein
MPDTAIIMPISARKKNTHPINFAIDKVSVAIVNRNIDVTVFVLSSRCLITVPSSIVARQQEPDKKQDQRA